jgi:hypothetical protein
VPVHPPWIPCEVTWDWTQGFVVTNHHQTAWAMVWPHQVICRVNKIQNVTIISRYHFASLHYIVTLHLYRCKNLILISLFIMRLNTENHSCNLLNKFNSDPYWSICYEMPNWDFMSIYINLYASHDTYWLHQLRVIYIKSATAKKDQLAVNQLIRHLSVDSTKCNILMFWEKNELSHDIYWLLF